MELKRSCWNTAWKTLCSWWGGNTALLTGWSWFPDAWQGSHHIAVRCVLGALCSQRCKTHVKGIIKHSPNRLTWDLLSKSWPSPSKYREERKAGSKQGVFLWSLKISKGFKSWSPKAAAVLQVAYCNPEPFFVCVVLPAFEEGEWEQYGGAELSIGVTPQRPPLSFTQKIELKGRFSPTSYSIAIIPNFICLCGVLTWSALIPPNYAEFLQTLPAGVTPASPSLTAPLPVTLYSMH